MTKDDTGPTAQLRKRLSSGARRLIRGTNAVEPVPAGPSPHRVELLNVLNAAAAALQHANTEERVLATLLESMSRIGVRGGVSLLDDDGVHMTVRLVAPPGAGAILREQEKATGIEASGYHFEADAVAAYRRALRDGEVVFSNNTAATLTQMVPESARPYLAWILDALGSSPGIYAPLRSSTGIIGVLTFAGDDLVVDDRAAVEAFANHIAVALENARLVAELRAANERLAIDVENRRRAEEAVRESEERFRSLAETAPDAIICLDEEARVTFWNDGAVRLFGHEVDAAVGRPLCDVILPVESRDRLGGAMRHYLNTGEGLRVGEPLEFTGVRDDGSERLVELSISRVRERAGWRATGIIRDITERRRMEQELQRIDKLESLGMLAGGIAHDFNNVLMAIVGRIGVAKRRLAESDPSRVDLQSAERAVEQARDLAGQLLTFGKGGAPLKEWASIRALISESAALVSRGSNTRCELDLPDDLWDANVDKGQITQVLNNLIINADHAMPDGGTLRVAAENVVLGGEEIGALEAGQYVRITVTDHGVGIAPEHLAKVFDPFFTTKKAGSGLGLATTFSVVSRHGGHIDVASEPGHGATFRVHLPASGTSSVAPAAPAPRVERGSERILLMDDEREVLLAVSKMLRILGYHVDTAEDGRAAIDRFCEARAQGHPYDLVILDLTVPGGMGGREAVAELRALEPELKAVVSSGYSTDPVIANHVDHGFDNVVVKPYGLPRLSRVLRETLGPSRSA